MPKKLRHNPARQFARFGASFYYRAFGENIKRNYIFLIHLSSPDVFSSPRPSAVSLERISRARHRRRPRCPCAPCTASASSSSCSTAALRRRGFVSSLDPASKGTLLKYLDSLASLTSALGVVVAEHHRSTNVVTCPPPPEPPNGGGRFRLSTQQDTPKNLSTAK